MVAKQLIPNSTDLLYLFYNSFEHGSLNNNFIVRTIHFLGGYYKTPFEYFLKKTAL